MGISILKFSPPAEPAIWQKIEELGFTVYGDLDISYPITETFAQPDSSLLRKIRNKSGILLQQSSVKAIGLFEYAPIEKESFKNAIQPYIRELKKGRVRRVYFTASNQQSLIHNEVDSSFVIKDIWLKPANIFTSAITYPERAAAYHFSPAPSIRQYLTPFKHFLSVTADYPNKPIFINSKWLLENANREPTFSTTIQTLTSESELIFPLPNESLPTDQTYPAPIIILVLIWASVALHYNSSPLYRKSLFRYFSAHKFFIDDIFQRHIRSVVPAIILIFQNAFLIATSTCAVSVTIFSSQGFDALVYHLPGIVFWGSGVSALAIWGFLISLLLALINIIWLYISHKNITSLTQIATIYAWPLQLNLIITSILIVLFSSGASSYYIVTAGILTIVVQLASFVITSFDSARYLSSRTLVYLMLTSGLYTFLVAAFFIWVATSSTLTETIYLAVSL